MFASVYNDQNLQSFVDLNQSNFIVMRVIIYNVTCWSNI